MGMTTDGLSYWQAESEEIELLDTTIDDLLYEVAFVTLFVTISRRAPSKIGVDEAQV